MGDYTKVEGTMVFGHGEMEKIVEVGIAKKGVRENEDRFFVTISDISSSVPIVVKDCSTCVVTILASHPAQEAAAKTLRVLDSLFNYDAIEEGTVQWKDQFIAAFRPVAGDDDDAEEASV